MSLNVTGNTTGRAVTHVFDALLQHFCQQVLDIRTALPCFDSTLDRGDTVRRGKEGEKKHNLLPSEFQGSLFEGRLL